ncbi:MAG: sodium-dependent transporter, partial [Planctomycetia bacterium]|nr:sodium-dependent transporter [Planctomycetia bacterium]
GLGNIWKFPYIAGENGGAAFIFVYLICIAIVGLPVVIAEILMGRTTQRNPVGAFRKLSGNKFWITIGGLGVVAGFIILSFYAVVAGWSTGYMIEALRGTFSSLTTAEQANTYFNSLVGDPTWMIGFYTIFFVFTMAFVFLGVKDGIEKGSKIMMPILFIILVILMVKGISLKGSEEGLAFLWKPDWSKITGQSVLIALGHAFFTLSLGMGALMTYGSYLDKKSNIPNAAVQIVFLDTLIALMAGVAIFTAVFAMGQDPGSGPGLIFNTLTVVFGSMTGGYIFGLLFFILLTLAALTSSISLLEVTVAYFVDERGWSRHKAVLSIGSLVFLFGIPSALSFNLLADLTYNGKTFFDIVDFIASNVLLPVGGFFISIFVAWIWGFDKALIKLKHGAENIFKGRIWLVTTFKIFLKYIAPVMIFIVFLHSISLLESAIEQVKNYWIIIILVIVILSIIISKKRKN